MTEDDPMVEEQATFRELEAYVADRFKPDEAGRSRLVPLLRDYVDLSQRLHRELAAIRAREINRFDRTIERAARDRGLVSDVPVEPDRELGETWELMDAIDSLEQTLTGRADDCQLLAALINQHQNLPLDETERRALRLRFLHHRHAQTLQQAVQLKTQWTMERRRLAHAGYDIDLNHQTLTRLTDLSNQYRQTRSELQQLEQEIETLNAETRQKNQNLTKW